MDHLKDLNPKQKEAALHKEGPLLIVAGAGAGKTKTITHRILNLIQEGVSPDNILAVTFTNKAAKEMRDRIVKSIADITKGQDSTPFISTFHSLGVYIIKENARALGLNKYFSILDEGEYLHIGLRILRGDIPYRDFFSYLPPLYDYWNVIAFKLFGISVFSPRQLQL